MGKNQSASNLPNIIQYNNGSINFVSGSTLLMQISSSGAITTTGVISGSNALSSSYASNSERLDNLDSTSFVFTSSYNSDSSSFSTRTTNLETASGSFSTRVTRIEGNYATTGSNVFLGAQTVCANITSTGTIIAQTLNVQQVTSSVVYSSGSNVFGCSLANTQQFTGSVLMTGSLTVTTAGTSPEFQVNSGGTIKGNALTDTHQITGSLRITGSVASFSNCVGIGTISPCHPLHVVACNVYHITAEQASTDINNVSAYATFFIINNAGASQIKGYLGAGGNSVGNTGMQNHVYAGAQTNHGFRLFTNDTARVTIANTGIACFACQVCAPSFISSGTICSAGNVTIASCLGIGTNSPSSYSHGGSNRVAEIFNSDTSANSQSHIILSTGASTIPGAIGSVTWVVPNSSAANKMGSYIGADIEANSSTTVCTNIFLASRNNEASPQIRLRVASSGIACFACQVCVPRLQVFNTNSIIVVEGTATSGEGTVTIAGKNSSGTSRSAIFKYDNADIIRVATADAIPMRFETSDVTRLTIGNTGIATFTCQVSIGPTLTVGNQGGTDTTVIGGGSGVGSSVRMNFAGGTMQNLFQGNGDNFVNCVTGKLNAAGGVKFANGSGTLNYYEVGTWTPQLYWTNGGYYCMSGVNGGNYVRIGNVVHVNYQIQWSALCGSSGFSGQLRIGGLPFVVGSLRSAGTISAISSGIGRSNSCITYHANTVDPGANFVYWIENDPAGGYSHSPSVGASGLVYSNQVTYIV